MEALTNIGGRRFALTLLCVLLTTCLVYAGKIDGSIYRDVLVMTAGAYIAGNTIQKIKGAGNA